MSLLFLFSQSSGSATAGWRSHLGFWAGGFASGTSGGANSIGDGQATEDNDQAAGAITNSSATAGWRSHLGFWAGGFAQVNAGSNSVSDGVATESDDSCAGLIGTPGVISGDMTENDDRMAGLMFDPNGIVDTGFLFEAES